MQPVFFKLSVWFLPFILLMFSCYLRGIRRLSEKSRTMFIALATSVTEEFFSSIFLAGTVGLTSATIRGWVSSILALSINGVPTTRTEHSVRGIKGVPIDRWFWFWGVIWPHMILTQMILLAWFSFAFIFGATVRGWIMVMGSCFFNRRGVTLFVREDYLLIDPTVVCL